MNQCPCGSQKPFSDCCQPYLDGKSAPTPEALMRSRYTAFALKRLDYVRDTTDPQAILHFDLEATKEWAEGSQFTKLEVLRTTDEGNKGVVEFKAYFKPKDAEAQIHHEIAKFRKQAGVWYFRDGRIVPAPTPKT